MNLLFILTSIVHVLFWTFIIFAFLNKNTAYYNLYYIVPATYIIHIFPIHFLGAIKVLVYPEEKERAQKTTELYSAWVAPEAFRKVRDNFFNFSYFNPLSAQGLLIFGAVTSAWSLKNYCNYDFI